MYVLYQDEHLIAVDKPSGYHVHPPENDYPVPRELICLYLVRDQIHKKVFPVHRLDVSTSGILLFALSREAARNLCDQFASQQIEKNYWAVVRGWTSANDRIDLPLKSDSTGELMPAETHYRRLAQIELPHAVGRRFPTARYSWLEVKPRTGRYHQIRRHMNRISFPLIGDGTHGDSRHNTFFRETLGIAGLCLRAQRIRFRHPVTSEFIELVAPPHEKWTRLENLFQFKPKSSN